VTIHMWNRLQWTMMGSLAIARGVYDSSGETRASPVMTDVGILMTWRGVIVLWGGHSIGGHTDDHRQLSQRIECNHDLVIIHVVIMLSAFTTLTIDSYRSIWHDSCDTVIKCRAMWLAQ
jgi:hypothetical protein